LAYKTHKIDIANVVLLLASVVFYAWGGVKYFVILFIIIVANYLLAIWMIKFEKVRTFLFGVILVIDIGNLFYYKYFNFFVENIQKIGTVFGYEILQNIASVALPIGISFYTFQIISYVADVYLGKVEVQKNPVKLALYVLMFPQLIAGPIVRYTDINNEINGRRISLDDVESGIKQFIIGFFKKVFVANLMGSMADTVFAMTGTVNMVYAWLGAICYTLQIYYDFSAYSDMAIGIGRIFGFHFNENFNFPYISQSIQEFWRRWHISLSSWFRDYVYIPLGGNRKGVFRTYINLCIVFLLTGFWHGAAWQYIVWGMYHGLFSIIERLGLKKILERIPRGFRHVYTMLVVILGWVFFRADNLTVAIQYIKNMFSFNFSNFNNIGIVTQFTNLFGIIFIVALIFSVTKFEVLNKSKLWSNVTFTRIRYLLLWIVSMLYLTGLSYNPFIYFKF
jgi:alginate O-acetyltransferase complex protein AlgI